MRCALRWFIPLAAVSALLVDPALGQAVFASLIGYLIAAMFLSKTYFEIPFIYLGLAAAVTGAVRKNRESSGSRRAATRGDRPAGR